MGRKKKNVEASIDDEMKLWYESNNIIYEKNQLYYDFFKMLFKIIENTYLGQDVINSDEVIYNHFKWCFNKTVTNFNENNINFKNNGPLFDYLWYFFQNSYYKNSDEKSIDNIYVFFENLFNYERIKTVSEQETYKFLYKLFEINLKK